MKFSSTLSLGLLASPILVSASPILEERQVVGINATDFSNIVLYGQYAAASYCLQNFQGSIGNRVNCQNPSLGSYFVSPCPLVQQANVTTVWKLNA